ncbi:hypothetical protein FRX31_010428, partial [Thalictrum thalictroides]
EGRRVILNLKIVRKGCFNHSGRHCRLTFSHLEEGVGSIKKTRLQSHSFPFFFFLFSFFDSQFYLVTPH